MNKREERLARVVMAQTWVDLVEDLGERQADEREDATQELLRAKAALTDGDRRYIRNKRREMATLARKCRAGGFD